MKTSIKNHFILICLTALMVIGCKQEPCKDVICLNGGICIEGNCDCEDGWEGIDCSDQLIPDNYYFNRISIRVNDTLAPSGESWDTGLIPNKYPDLEVFLFGEGFSNQIITLSGDELQENAQPFVYHEFKFEGENVLFSSGELVTIRVYDRQLEGEPYEVTDMLVSEFYPYDEDNKSHSRIIENHNITINLDFEPVW